MYVLYSYIYISQIVLYELLNSRKARHFDISNESVRSLHMSLGYLAPVSYLAKTCQADCWARHWDTDTRRNLFIDLPRNAVITWLHEPHFRDIIQSGRTGAPTHCMQHVVEERNWIHPSPNTYDVNIRTPTHAHTCLKFGLLSSWWDVKIMLMSSLNHKKQASRLPENKCKVLLPHTLYAEYTEYV